MTVFISTVKNSRPSTHWKYFTKSNEVTILKKAILVVQSKINPNFNPGNVSKFAKQFCERCAKRQNLYEMSHLI